jgi:CheY-like chemotaxis protein
MHFQETPQPDRKEIEKWLRDALNHLFDIGYLETHPLGEVLVRPEESTGKRGQDLRRVLISAIQARHPPRGTPVQSPDWRGYQILEQHVLAGLTPSEVAQKLNISRSLFFLEKTRILKIVLDDLWSSRVMVARSMTGSAEPEGQPNSEAEQLLQNMELKPVEIRPLLESLRPLVAPLAQAQDTRIVMLPPGEGIIPHGDRVLLRQVLLSLVNELLQLVAGGEITISTFDQADRFGIQISGRQPQQERLELRLEERRGLQPETAYAIIQQMNGTINIDITAGGAYRAVLAWRIPQQAGHILLVDDHPDIADLFARYLEGTGWETVWASSADHARRILGEMRPAVIVLDVIMPHEDGWEFLIALKSDLLTRDIPVLVCSAINEPDLVRSLGAQGYLPKPFTAAQLVQALTA